jgi:hypothetical protein
MNRVQKVAWFLMITFLAAVVVSCIAILVLYFYFKIGMPRAMAGLGFIGLAGFGGLGPLIFKKDKGAVTYDERDKIIHLNASRAAFGIFFITSYLLSFVAVPLLRGANGTISVHELWLLFGIASIPFWPAWAIMVLMLYGKEKSNE